MRRENSAVDFVRRWRPFGLIAGVSLVGLLLGVVVGLFACSPAGVLTGAKEEAYYVLASKLYRDGENLDAMKAHLGALESRDVPSTMKRLAEKYAQSSDENKRAEAEDLRQLAEALRSPGLLSSLARAPMPSVVALASQPSATPGNASAIVLTPFPVTTQATQTPTPTMLSTPTGPSRPEPVTGNGVARPAGGGGAVLREQPSTKSRWVASVPNGAKVEVLKVVEGEAVDPAEPRWYQIKYGDRVGYMYFKLIAQGE